MIQPVGTFSEGISFHLNDDKADARHIPRYHSDGDAIIHFTSTNVIDAGDVLFESR